MDKEFNGFKVGDVVTLKSGGPDMTVQLINPVMVCQFSEFI
jgi:uncharacterized protein YodC (DUF2158 family)